MKASDVVSAEALANELRKQLAAKGPENLLAVAEALIAKFVVRRTPWAYINNEDGLNPISHKNPRPSTEDAMKIPTIALLSPRNAQDISEVQLRENYIYVQAARGDLWRISIGWDDLPIIELLHKGEPVPAAHKKPPPA